MSQWKYILDAPVRHQTPLAVPFRFKNDWLEIVAEEGCACLTVAKGYAWDGATLVPDAKGTYFATALHDAVYQFCEDIAAAWRWTVRQVIKWADRIFKERMIQDGASRFVARLYYRGVRLFGYAYHQAARAWRGPCGGPCQGVFVCGDRALGDNLSPRRRGSKGRAGRDRRSNEHG